MRLLFFPLICVFLQPVAAEDWPRWRGPRGDGSWNGPKVSERLPEKGLERIWKHDLNPGYSGVTVSGTAFTPWTVHPPTSLGKRKGFYALTH